MNVDQIIYVIATSRQIGASKDYIKGLEKMASVALQTPISEIQRMVKEMLDF